MIEGFGRIKRVGKSNELLIDIDDLAVKQSSNNVRSGLIAGYAEVHARKLVELGVQWSHCEIENSAGMGVHFIYTLKRKYDPSMIVALQFALGSDPWREFMNLSRILGGAKEDGWNILFDVKVKS